MTLTRIKANRSLLSTCKAPLNSNLQLHSIHQPCHTNLLTTPSLRQPSNRPLSTCRAQALCQQRPPLSLPRQRQQRADLLKIKTTRESVTTPAEPSGASTRKEKLRSESSKARRFKSLKSQAIRTSLHSLMVAGSVPTAKTTTSQDELNAIDARREKLARTRKASPSICSVNWLPKKIMVRLEKLQTHLRLPKLQQRLQAPCLCPSPAKTRPRPLRQLSRM